MASAAPRIPKQWQLTKTETINSFESWRANLIYSLSLDRNFAPFLVNGVTWQKASVENRGLQADGEAVPEASRRTAAQKAASLEMMLGQIAIWCPVISKNTIVKASTSLSHIWQAIRLHFGFQSTGGYFLDIANIKQDTNERPEDLYQRLTAAIEDNLLSVEGGITHHGEVVTADEEVSPSLENMIVLLWLQLLHPNLPALVKQRYGSELRNKTLASIKPEISLALASLLDELNTTEDIRSLRLSQARKPSPRFRPPPRPQRPKPKAQYKACPLCQQAGRPGYNHFLSECRYLPEQDKQYIIRSRVVEVDEDEHFDELDYTDQDEPQVLVAETVTPPKSIPSQVSRVTVRPSPYMDAFHHGQSVHILLDSGAESSLIREDEAHSLGLQIVPNYSQTPSQADGGRMSGILGECKTTFSRHTLPLQFDALVVKDLASPIIAGSPFLETNGFTIDFKHKRIQLPDGSTTDYSPVRKPSQPRIHRISTNLLRMQDRTTTVWPGDFIDLALPVEITDYQDVVLEPRYDSLSPEQMKAFEQGTYRNVAGHIRVPNVSSAPVHVAKNMHLFNAVPVVPVEDYPLDGQVYDKSPTPAHPPTPFSDSIQLDPDHTLSSTQRYQLSSVLRTYDQVFDTAFPGYNDAVGPIRAVVNMGPAQPPQRKGRLPLYGRNRLVELQQKLDELETRGVIATPESADTVVEYLNPSFLINKSSGGHRLVTAFTDVAKYCKPQPSLLPDVNQVMRQIACWKYIIVSDLTSAYHQIPLHVNSRKYCGIVTPFKGIRVYCRSAMGMPGSETALEELMSRTLGHLLMRGAVAKIADDLYCGGNTFEELLINWRDVLTALRKCDLRLSPSKTIICPRSTTILGWHWNQGQISASQHTLCTLATCPAPQTVTALRSYIGSYKALSRVIPGTSVLLGPLDNIIAGQSSKDKVQWTDETMLAFRQAQRGLQAHQAVVLPRPEDELWLVTDAAVRL